jgi:hypothetical protein
MKQHMKLADKALLLAQIKTIREMCDECEQLIYSDNEHAYNDELNNVRHSLALETQHLSKALYPFIRIKSSC